MFHLEEAMQFHQMICIVKEREAHMVEYPAFNCPIKWVERDNYVEPNSNLGCGRLWVYPTKEEQVKGANTKIIHKHQPCTWGLTMVMDRKRLCYDQTFVKVAKSTEEAMQLFVAKILEIS